MADIITTGTSGYSTGSIDTATVIVNNVSPTDAKQINGCAAAIVQIEGILGSGTTLKGNKADLGARLAVSLTADGTISSTGAAGITLEDSRTNSVATVLTLTATTSGTPASGIGSSILVRAESGDETPSDAGSIDFVFTDVGAGTEDSLVRLNTRRAGAALAGAWVAQCTGTQEGIITHANTAQRTYTFPDYDGTVATRAGTETFTNKTITSGANSLTIDSGGVVKTGGIATATGSSTIASASGTITRHDYTLSISRTCDNNDRFAVESIPSTADPSDTVSRDYLVYTAIGTGGTYTDRWRYCTASDNPEIWVAIDNITSQIRGTWAADDPTGDSKPGVLIVGCQSLRLKANDLEQWSVLSAKASEADAYIRDKKLKQEHQAFRALQLLANDVAPAKWLLENCEIKQGKLEVKAAKAK